MGQIFVVTCPFFMLVLAGYLATRRGMLPLEAIPGLNVFVLFFALPCMLFRFAAVTPIVRLLDPGVSLTYLAGAFSMVALVVASTRGSRRRWNDRAFGALVAVFPNSGFMGVPLLVALLGSEAAGPAIVALAIDMVFTSSLCIALSRLDAADEHGAARAVRQALRGMVRNPLPWAIALGCLSTATGWQLPGPFLRAVQMLADAASPAALFTIGAVLARSRAVARAPSRRTDVPLLVAFKVIVHPALVYALGRAAIALGAPLQPFALEVLTLSAALPSASNVPMLAERFGADSARIVEVVLISTTVAFLTFPITVALLGQR